MWNGCQCKSVKCKCDKCKWDNCKCDQCDNLIRESTVSIICLSEISECEIY